MTKFRIIVAAAAENVAAIMSAIMAVGMAESVTVEGEGNGSTALPITAADVAHSVVASSAPAVVRKPRNIGSGKALTVLMPGHISPRVTWDAKRMKTALADATLKLTPQAQIVAGVILHKPGLTMAETYAACANAGVPNFHSVDGAVFQLRTKGVIESVPRPAATK